MMSFLSGSQPFDAEVEKATSEKCTKEDWALIMEICDKIGNSPQNAKDCLRSIVRRLNAQDPHIVMLAITLLDACSSNCGKVFHLEVASREFETQFIKLINNSRQQQQPKIYEKFKSTLKKWAEGDYKSDPQLNLIPSLYQKLKSEGHDFSSTPEMQSRPNYTNKDPNFVSSNQEAEELARAIELSLKESTKQSTITHSSPSTKKTTTTTSLYPTVNALMATSANSEGRKVKALYDFEAVEDNELTFSAGEIIHILDDSDPNWWKGSNQRGEGLFPSNFVTADLSVEPEQYTKSNKKSVQFSEEVEVKTVKKEPEVVEIDINEEKMDRLLHLLHEADPQSGSTDPQEMLDLEEQVTAMGPLIDTALEKVDKQHAQLTQLSSDLVEAMNLYHTLMREPAISSYTLPKMPPQQMVYPFPHPQAGPHQAGHPQHPMAGHPHAAHPHLQGPHPQAAHPQAGLPQGPHPQGAPAHMFNGMPPGPQSQMMPGPQPRYNANMPPSGEMINTQQGPTSLPSMTLPHHYYQMHPALRQMPPEARQDSPQANQNNIPYAQQGYPEQTNVGHNVSVSYMSQVPPGQPISNQQPQIASPNGQRMM